MGFVSPQFDVIDNNFLPHPTKSLEVICSKKIQTFRTITAISAIADALRDPNTGLLLPNRTLVASVRNMAATVGIDKVFNIFTTAATVVDTTNNEPIVSQTVLVDDVVDCPGVRPGDVLQKHDIQPHATFAVRNAAQSFVFITVWINACVIVARESALQIQAAEPFCP
ncbi:MAG TPA: hypothetical protein GXX29_03470 [Firmicutes bacterium]|nr:hypothetical protein [Bacillota bacterium]